MLSVFLFNDSRRNNIIEEKKLRLENLMTLFYYVSRVIPICERHVGMGVHVHDSCA